MASKNVTEALDSIREVLEGINQKTSTISTGQMQHPSAAATSPRHSRASGKIEFPMIALGPFEQVLAMRGLF